MFKKTKTQANGIFKKKAVQGPAVLLTHKRKLKKLQNHWSILWNLTTSISNNNLKLTSFINLQNFFLEVFLSKHFRLKFSIDVHYQYHIN